MTFKLPLMLLIFLACSAFPTGRSFAQDDGEDASAEGSGDTESVQPEESSPVPSNSQQKSRGGAQNSGASYLSLTTVALGLGRTSLGGDGKKFGATAWQWGLHAGRGLYTITDGLTLGAALDLRYSNHSNDLTAVRIGNGDAKSNLRRYDYALLADLRYAFFESFAVFTDLGPAYQSRVLYIQADSGDDYYKDTAFGYLWRLGAQYSCPTAFGMFVGNLVYAASNGGSLDSGRLKYNLDSVNYNGPARTIGIELGLML